MALHSRCAWGASSTVRVKQIFLQSSSLHFNPFHSLFGRWLRPAHIQGRRLASSGTYSTPHRSTVVAYLRKSCVSVRSRQTTRARTHLLLSSQRLNGWEICWPSFNCHCARSYSGNPSSLYAKCSVYFYGLDSSPSLSFILSVSLICPRGRHHDHKDLAWPEGLCLW